MFAQAAKATLFLSLASTAAATGGTRYVAQLGEYGSFEMEISADDGTMVWKSDLKNLDELATSIGREGGMFPFLNYHLHQQWTNADADYGIGGDACGPAVTGGHYDPYFGCGPASGVPRDQCTAIGRERSSDRYACAGAYDRHEYDSCEVGDLSGKDGPLEIKDGAIRQKSLKDPLPAINAHFESEVTAAGPGQFASIVFHDGSPRVLCGRLVKMEEAPKEECSVTAYEVWDSQKVIYEDVRKDDSPVICNSFLKSGFNIRAMTKGCSNIQFELDGPMDFEYDRTEYASPYFLFGDTDGMIHTKTLREGSYTLAVYADGQKTETLVFDVNDTC